MMASVALVGGANGQSAPADGLPTLAPATAPATPSPAAPAGPAPAAETPTSQAQATLNLSAGLNGGLAPLPGGLRWRIFATTPAEDGTHALIAKSSMAEPTFTLPPGDYVVHVAFGLASATKRVSLGSDVRSEQLMLSAGGTQGRRDSHRPPD